MQTCFSVQYSSIFEMGWEIMEFGGTIVICILAKKAPKFIEYLNTNLFPILLSVLQASQ